MSKGKNKSKAKPRKDNSARIARGAAKKARNVAANESRHLDNLRKLSEMGVASSGHGHRPSVMVRLATRAAAQLRVE